MKKKVSMLNLLGSPKYRGKHIILVADKVFTAKTQNEAAKVLKEVRERYPGVTPEVAYLPKSTSLILWI